MLVLSRRQNEKILFPNLGISLQVMRLCGKTVSLGIDAPPEIRILREEVAKDGEHVNHAASAVSRKLRHDLRNRLNTACLGLRVVQRQLEIDETNDVELTISKVMGELQEIDAELQSSSHGGGAQQAAGARSALIVEDNPNESKLLAAYLKMCGYQVATVEDGLQALMYLKENKQPDAVLLDMCMPRLNGPKTVTSIRCNPELEGIKLFAVSGANRNELGVDVGPRGVDRWFAKPIDVRHLVDEMNRELETTALSV